VQPQIVRPDEADEYYFKEGCHILEVMNSADDPALSIARARVATGATTRLHVLSNTAERYYILSGSGMVTVGDIQQAVSDGDVVIIPAGVAQKIKNTGSDDLVFLAMCTPRFKPENYRDIDNDIDNDINTAI